MVYRSPTTVIRASAPALPEDLVPPPFRPRRIQSRSLRTPRRHRHSVGILPQWFGRGEEIRPEVKLSAYSLIRNPVKHTRWSLCQEIPLPARSTSLQPQVGLGATAQWVDTRGISWCKSKTGDQDYANLEPLRQLPRALGKPFETRGVDVVAPDLVIVSNLLSPRSLRVLDNWYTCLPPSVRSMTSHHSREWTACTVISETRLMPSR